MTRLPLGGFPFTESEWRWAAGWFPFVGFVLGLLLAGCWLVGVPLGPEVTATLVVALAVFLTGAFHEDGLADTADALGGTFEREEALAVFKDSRIGTYGAVALIVSILLRVVLLARVAPMAPLALVLSHTFARIIPVWQIVALPYVTNTEVSKSPFVGRVGIAQALFATALGGSVLVGTVVRGLLTWNVAVTLVLALVLVASLTGMYFWRRLQGVNGDCLGATEQLGEVAVLLVLAAHA